MSLFDRLRTKVNAETLPASSEVEELNAALVAYVHTFPQQKRLQTYLESLGKLERQPEIEARLQTALKSTEDFLYAQIEGIRWSEQFEALLFEHVVSSSPWLSKQAFRSLVSFGGWLCWHEGLNA